MTVFNAIRDPAAVTKLQALTAQSGVAAGTGDNTELTSAAINRMPVGSPGFLSMVLGVSYLTTVASAQTLKLTVKISESDDGSSWGADETLVNAATLETGVVTAKYAAYELGLDLSGRKQYVRFKLTMDLSAGSTDTFLYASTAILTGSSAYPV